MVVFGSYANWTYEDVFQNATTIETEDPAYENFCKYEPMMFAFVQLIISWVMIPLDWCLLRIYSS